MDLKGKRILLIAPIFFGYELEIIKEMESRGAKVDYIADRPFDKPWQKALNRAAPVLLKPQTEKLFKKKLSLFDTNANAEQYEIVLVIKGLTLSLAMHEELKRRYPLARKILYMWDSMENCPSVDKTLHFYDVTFSFDPEDAKKYKMKMRPLFFTKGFEKEFEAETANLYDISFIGTVHSDRYDVITKIKKSLPQNIKCYWYLYLQAKWVYAVYKIIKSSMRRASIKDFKFISIAKNEVQNVFKHSHCIVDIEHSKQRGLTMRTFETLGASKKLITTNSQITSYDFYDKNNILIINRLNPIIPNIFFQIKYKSINPSVYYKYSLSGWLDELLSI
jgi:hypothetical protein